ncbi:hypothetical protein VULLAG_LOCUS18301 [Vulpes lagopus]
MDLYPLPKNVQEQMQERICENEFEFGKLVLWTFGEAKFETI